MFMDPSLGVVHLRSTIGQLGSQLGKGKIKSQALSMSLSPRMLVLESTLKFKSHARMLFSVQCVFAW